MGFQDAWENFSERLQDWLENSKEYFSDLNDQERYGWIAEGTGIVVFLVGIVMFFV